MFYISAPFIFGLIALFSVGEYSAAPEDPWREAALILLWIWGPAAVPPLARALNRLRNGTVQLPAAAQAAKAAALGAFFFHTLWGSLAALTNLAMSSLPLTNVRLTAAFIPLLIGMLLIDLGSGGFRLANWTRRLKLQLLPVLPLLAFLLIGDLFDQYAPFSARAAAVERPWLVVLALLLFLIGSYAFAPALLRRLWRTEKLADPELSRRARAIADRNAAPFRQIAVWKAGRQFSNALVTGLLPRFRDIFVSESLVAEMEPNELEAIVAHEIGHIKRGHLHLYLLFSLSYLGSCLLLFSALQPILPAYLADTPFGSALTACAFFFFYFALLFGFVSRRFERQADYFAATNIADPEAYVRALSKLAPGARSSRPRRARLLRWIQTHPPIDERIEFVRRAAEGDPSAAAYSKPLWVSKAVAASAPILLIALILFRGTFIPSEAEAAGILSLLYLYEAERALRQIEELPEESNARKKLSDRRAELMAKADDQADIALLENPNDPDLIHVKGAVSLYSDRLEEAEAAFERALAIKPRHMNSLYAMAGLRAEQKRWSDAEELARRVAEEQPDNALVISLMERIQTADRKERTPP